MAQLAPDLTRTDDLPVGVQLAWRIRVLIASGQLESGARLPGVRELAKGAGINVNTARTVYGRLEEEGLIRSEHGQGTFVASRLSPAPQLEQLAADAVQAARDNGVEPLDLARAIYAGSGAETLGGDLGDEGLPPDFPEAPATTWGDERSGRSDLRDQIARLEAQLAPYPEARAEGEPTHPLLRPKGHLQSLGELEAIRDELMQRLRRAQQAAGQRGDREVLARTRLEEMVSDPAAHRWETISNKELGEPGCSTFEVQPRWGPVGALMNWWRVKVSSGCPLAGAA